MNLTKCITDCRWDALFDELDTDKNGTLSHSEFWSKMAIKNSSDLMDALNKFDVSFMILRPFRTIFSSKFSINNHYNQIIQKVDTNNDHKISRAEFIQHMKLSTCIVKEQWDALFDELDVDNSGHLDYSEFWAKMAIKNSPTLSEALNQFDVSKK